MGSLILQTKSFARSYLESHSSALMPVSIGLGTRLAITAAATFRQDVGAGNRGSTQEGNLGSTEMTLSLDAALGLWTLGIIQLLGLASAWLARLSEGSTHQSG